MRYFLHHTLSFALPVCFALSSFVIVSAQTDMFWVGGSGDWTDINHWVKNSGGSNITGFYPNEDYNAVIDGNSGLTPGSTITIPPGAFAVKDMTVSNTSGFTLLFDGSSGNHLEMNVYGDLDLNSGFNLAYTSADVFHNKWKFVSANTHMIQTGNQDLNSIEFFTEGATYNQPGPLLATKQIRMYGGTWNSNGHDVTTDKLLFHDGISSGGAQLVKVFNSAGSDIFCDRWDSRFTYGSLTVSGDLTVYTTRFEGHPAGGGPTLSIHKLHLLELPDNNPPEEPSVIEYNNFECTGCIIESMVIEDTGRTRLAGAFTIADTLKVVNSGLSVEFNGGNLRSNEVTINGIVSTPKVLGCENRTVFTNVFNDFTSLISTSGTLTISDAIVNNIQTTGGANFNLSNGVLQGSSSGWNLVNNPTPLIYTWNGVDGIYNDWNDPANWLVGATSNGCIPSIVDDVDISTASEGDIRIPQNYTAECRNFIWTNKNGLDLKLDGSPSLKSSLKVTGEFQLDLSATITPVNYHELLFSSNTNNSIITNGVQLPNIRFIGDMGQWALQTALTCDQIIFEGGTLVTQNQDVTTDYWLSLEDYPKHYEFGSSHILVNGEFALARPTVDGVTVNHGTSLIECQQLTSKVLDLYDVKFSNTSPRTLGNYPYHFNSLILNSVHQLTTQNDLTLNDLVFNVSGSTLAIDAGDVLHINGGMNSLASVSNPGTLKSKTAGSRADVDKNTGNICATGFIAFQDIDAVLGGVFNAPQGIDSGNNAGINFDDGSSSLYLYWIAQNGGTWQVQSNWSRVDGGCPASKNPADSPNLAFNSNSFSSSPITVDIPAGTTANDIHFMNTENLTVNVASSLTSDNIYVNGGYINFIGKTVDVMGTTDILSSGVMTIDMTNFFKSNEMHTISGVFIIRNGMAKIEP